MPFVRSMKMRPIDEFDIGTWQREEDLKSARYVNNFFFFADSKAPAAIRRLQQFLARQSA